MAQIVVNRLAQIPSLAHLTEPGQIHVMVKEALVHIRHVARLGVLKFTRNHTGFSRALLGSIPAEESDEEFAAAIEELS